MTDDTVVEDDFPPGVPVLEVDIEQVMAYEERDEEAAYEDDDYRDDNETEDEGGEADETQVEDEHAEVMDDM